MKELIVISGKQLSGKDTFAKILLEKMPDFKRIGIGDAIKIEYSKIKNITLDEIEKNKHLYRKDLIELGNSGREQDKLFWLKNISKMNKIIVPDVRVVDEIVFFKSMGAFCIRIESNIENRLNRGIIVQKNDNTEIALDNYRDWDVVVYNNSSLSDLKKQAGEVFDLYKTFAG